jgi:hypothetical protein
MTWDRKFINDLPDAAFAVIEKGGKKDATGRTKPRDLRHLPHHNSSVKTSADDSTVNKAHLRNALARVSLTDLSKSDRKKAERHLRSHAKRLGIG